MDKFGKYSGTGKKKVLVKGYTTNAGREVPDHYRSSPTSTDAPRGTFIERRLLNPKKPR